MKIKKMSLLFGLATCGVLVLASSALATTPGGTISNLSLVQAAQRFVELLKYLAAFAAVCFLAGAAFCYIRGGEATQWVSTCFTAVLVCGSVWGGTKFIEWLMGGDSSAVIVIAKTATGLIAG